MKKSVDVTNGSCHQLYLSPIILAVMFIGACPQLFADDAPVPDAWQEMKGQDFNIYYRPSVPDDFVQTTMDTAEDELKRVCENLGLSDSYWPMEKKISIYIYNDQKDYIRNGGQAGWSHGAAFAAAKTIKAYPDIAGFFDTVLPHELGHIVFRDYIGFDAQIPLWFEEGVAIYQEKAKRLGSNDAVKEALENGQFIPLTQLSGMRLYKNSKNDVVDLFYTESASVVYYMITELGDQSFEMLLGEIKNGTPFTEALHKVYLKFENVGELNQAWADYLQG